MVVQPRQFETLEDALSEFLGIELYCEIKRGAQRGRTEIFGVKQKQNLDVVVARCKGLSVLCFGGLDLAGSQFQGNEKTRSLLQALSDDPERFQLDDEAQSLVDELLKSPDIDTVNKALWKLEELGTLLWSLGLIENMPALTQQFDDLALMALQKLGPIATWRSDQALEHYQELLESVLWRFHVDLFQMMGRTGDPASNKIMIAKKVSELCQRGILAESFEGDISFDGIPFPRLEPKRKSSIQNIAQRRLNVFKWLFP